MNAHVHDLTDQEKEGILMSLAFAAFLILFNAYLIAPLIPTLAIEMSANNQQMGLIVPAFLLPYGISTLFYGPLSDRIGRKKVLLFLLFLSVILCIVTSFARSVESFIVIRVISGLCAGGIVPIALALVGDIFPFKKLGRAMGWMFGAIAGGMSFGSTLGAWLNPYIGWRNEFIALAVANGLAFLIIRYKLKKIIDRHDHTKEMSEFFKGYVALLKNPRGGKTYTLIFLNGVFHSGVFTWMGLYLKNRYGLGDIQIGIALLGYGLPGMLLGPAIGKLADRYGRSKIIPMGFLTAAICAFLLIPNSSLWIFATAITILSLGLDMSHPLMAGIILSMDPSRRGQAVGLNSFALFVGMGVGALMFQLLLNFSFITALTVFATVQFILAVLALKIFQNEK